MYKPISLKLQNSFVSFKIIEKYPWEYQALLEKIADFLVEDGLFWTELEHGVQFNDITAVDSKKAVHHFRSYSLSQELSFVEECWHNSCLKNPDKLIPACKVKIEDDEGIPSIRILKTLKYFAATILENSYSPCNDYIEDISQPYLALSGIDSPKTNFLTSTPKPGGNKLNSFYRGSTSSITKDIEKVMSSDDDGVDSEEEEDEDDKVLQIIPESTNDIVLQKEENVYGKTTNVLINVLGKSKLIEEYDRVKKLLKKYPNDKIIYWKSYQKLVAQLEVKINIEEGCLKMKLKDVEQKKMKNNFGSIDLIPTGGIFLHFCVCFCNRNVH